MKNRIKVGIVGSTGYVGSELTRLLYNHDHVDIVSLTSKSYVDKNYGDIFENYRHTNIICHEENLDQLADECDVIFIALPHGVLSKKLTEKILNKVKIIDLGADYRLKDKDIYEKWYNTNHESSSLLKEAVYGLCEINREDIKKARLIGNPGCYTTCSILSLYPLVKENLIDTQSIIIDAKSGVTGAGRSINLGTHFCETNESIKAYKLASHRHTPEIEEQLSYASEKKITLLFTPHLVPMNRGILTTSYATLNNKVTSAEIKAAYEKHYGSEYFIRLTKENVFPETKWVKGSNFVDIGFQVDNRCNRIIVIGAIDNLVRGAAGQAVQNMNILFNYDEKTGINQIPIFPS